MRSARKKPVITIALFVVISALLPGRFCLGSKGELSAKKANARLYAKMHINKLCEQARKQEVDVNDLCEKMLQNPAKYQNRRQAWDNLKQEQTQMFTDWYQKEVKLVLQAIDRNYFTKEERDAFLKPLDEVVKDYLDKNFGKSHTDGTTVFGKARKKAYESQLNKLTKDVYPTESEVDTAVAKRQLNNLRIKILNQLIKKQKEPVFSENVSTLSSDFVNPILDDAKKQLEKQGSIVTGSSGASYVVPEDIRNFISREITTYQNKLKQEKQGKTIANKVYKMFPSVKKKVDDEAGKIAIKRFRNAISEMNLSVDKKVLKKLISGSLSVHADKDKSWSTCLKRFRQDIVNKAIDNHAVKAPKDKQSDFRNFLSSLISNSDQSCKDAMNKLVDRSLKQEFDRIRKEIAQQQFRDFFGPLEQGSWPSSEKADELIDKWYNKSVNISESEALKMPDVSSRSFNSKDLLKETIEMVREAEEAGIKTGLDALRSQMSTVERLEFQVKSQIRNMRDLTIEKVIEIYTQKVNSSWSSKDYPHLFTRTQKEIKRRAKDILDLEIARQRQIANDKAKADKARADAKARAQLEDKGRSDILGLEDSDKPGKPGGGGDPNKSGKPGGGTPDTFGGPPGGKGPAKEQEEPGDQMPDVILDFGYESGKVYADIMFPKESKDKLRLFMDLSVNLNSSNMVIARKLFADWLKDAVKKSKKDQQDINFYVFARVFHGSSVLYSMVYYFRECLIKALEDTGDKRIKIHWYDRLFYGSSDIEKYRGKPILPPKFDKKLMPRLV